MDRIATILVLCFISSAVFAETKTTENLLPDISEFSASGGTVVGPARGAIQGSCGAD